MHTIRMKHHIALRAHDTIIHLETVLKKTRDPGLKTRLKAIVLRRQGQSPQEIAKSLVVTDRSVTGWINRYNAGGIRALETRAPGRAGGNPKWDTALFGDLAKEIDKGGYWSIPRMQEWLKKHHKKDIPEQTVWYRMDQLKYSYKSSRPHPMQGNKERQEDFKKGASSRSWSR